MSTVDFRRLVELGADAGAAPAYWAVVVEQPTDPRPIRLDVNLGGEGIVLALDYSEAGELFDTLAQAMGVVISGSADRKLKRVTLAYGDTPVEAVD